MLHGRQASRLLALRTGVAPLILAVSLAAPASAQDSPVTGTPGGVVAPGESSTPGTASPGTVAAPQLATDDVSQVIVVTGSRIARPDLSAPVPVAIVNATAIQQSGAGNIQDTLSELPSFGSNLTSRSTTNFSSSGNGSAILNLRNLGEPRTLVLINGRRTVGVPGSSATDVNNIPTDFIERVEIVTGGASAVYGSEAIAGVVNFILKDKFDGLRVRAQHTTSSKGDARRQLLSITGGRSFGDDRGHIMANFSYDTDRGLRSADRSFSARDIPNRSSYAAQGLFSFDTLFLPGATTFTFDADNNLKQYQGANIDGFNRNSVRYLAVPVERYIASTLGNYELTDNVTAYFEAEYSHTKSNSSLEPLATGNNPPVPVLSPDGSPYPGIPLTNPFIPQGILTAVAAFNAAGAGDPDFVPVTNLQFRRRSNDIFDRSNRARRDYYRGVLGLKGDFSDKWHWDAYYEHSQTKDSTRAENALATNYGAALNAIRDPSGNIVCADPAARAVGCVPINIFGFNTVSPAAAAFLRTDTGPAFGGLVAGSSVDYTYLAKVKQDVVNASVVGELFTLPGGAVTIAAGAEYRREKDSETYDRYTQAGIGLGNQIPNTSGKFNVKEAFVETVVPIFADKPFIKYFGLEGAARYAKYSTVGGVLSYKFGGAYAPTSDIRFRAIYARATRAPNIGELFSPPGQTFPAVVDPCDQGAGAGDDAVIDPSLRVPLPAGCAAIPGVAAQATTAQGFTYSTAQLQGVDGLIGGNANLTEETAQTLTVGTVITPRFARNVSMTVDYYRIKVKNAIGQIGQQVSLDQCLTSGDTLFCSNIERNGQGFVTRVNGLNLNVGSYLVSGLDIEGRFHADLEDIDLPGKIDFSIFWNHLFKQQQTPFPGGPVQNERGQADCYECGRLGSGFHNRVNASLVYSVGALTLNYRVDYLSPLVDDKTDPDAIRIPAYFYHNAQARYDFGRDRRFGLYAGANNLFDKKPPVFNDTNPVAFPGTQTVASTYDVFGRLLYAGIDVKF